MLDWTFNWPVLVAVRDSPSGCTCTLNGIVFGGTSCCTVVFGGTSCCTVVFGGTSCCTVVVGGTCTVGDEVFDGTSGCSLNGTL